MPNEQCGKSLYEQPHQQKDSHATPLGLTQMIAVRNKTSTGLPAAIPIQLAPPSAIEQQLARVDVVSDAPARTRLVLPESAGRHGRRGTIFVRPAQAKAARKVRVVRKCGPHSGIGSTPSGWARL